MSEAGRGRADATSPPTPQHRAREEKIEAKNGANLGAHRRGIVINPSGLGVDASAGGGQSLGRGCSGYNVARKRCNLGKGYKRGDTVSLQKISLGSGVTCGPSPPGKDGAEVGAAELASNGGSGGRSHPPVHERSARCGRQRSEPGDVALEGGIRRRGPSARSGRRSFTRESENITEKAMMGQKGGKEGAGGVQREQHSWWRNREGEGLPGRG